MPAPPRPPLPDRFERALNLQAAKAMRLMIPPLLQVRADEVIE